MTIPSSLCPHTCPPLRTALPGLLVFAGPPILPDCLAAPAPCQRARGAPLPSAACPGAPCCAPGALSTDSLLWPRRCEQDVSRAAGAVRASSLHVSAVGTASGSPWTHQLCIWLNGWITNSGPQTEKSSQHRRAPLHHRPSQGLSNQSTTMLPGKTMPPPNTL